MINKEKMKKIAIEGLFTDSFVPFGFTRKHRLMGPISLKDSSS